MQKGWLVTGCSQGLGRALAEALLAAGHRLIATARDPRDLTFLPASGRLRTVALVVTDAAAARAAVAAAISAFGRLDVVVNDASIIKANSIEDLSEDDFRRQIEINFFGVYNVTRVSDVLAREVAPLGIRVTCIEPEGMRTEMFGTSRLAEPLAPDYGPTVAPSSAPPLAAPRVRAATPARWPRRFSGWPTRSSRRCVCYWEATPSPPLPRLQPRGDEDARWKTLSVSTDHA